MPEAWDVTKLGAAPGSGGCATSVTSCAAVYNFLLAQNKDTSTYATSPIWSVVDGPWKLSSFSSIRQRQLRAEREVLGQPEAEDRRVQVRAVHQRHCGVLGAEVPQQRAQHRLHPAAGPAAEATELGGAG